MYNGKLRSFDEIVLIENNRKRLQEIYNKQTDSTLSPSERLLHAKALAIVSGITLD